MKRFAISVLLSLIGTSAFAADMAVKAPPPPPPPIATWTGFYLGINGGWGWGTTRHTDDFGVTSGNFSTNGGVAGGTYGFNWQVNQFVIGFEGDFDWADIKGTFTSPLLCSINGGTTCFTTLRNLGTDRLRVGYDVNGWLLYGTAGVGYGEVKSGQNPCGLTAFGGFSCNTSWRTGWVAGGGVEKMFAPHWSAKLEYLHYDLGTSIGYTPTLIGGAVNVRTLERGDMVRAGINYRFDWPGGPVVARY
ncbi:outer membrane protein [Bradyrhizobium sp. AZCC 2230]|uniref:outer membrane protein n=1 Tax=Bradyrhizobium sp. AZCC 2230 TaxID=3117021 RepID=UPI002FEF41BE